ncbi:hypothetical protein FJY84_02780 [Candidatus Bathyarchaeota archaeon]|nr:hypothetical protein [Candidatus Bathyarchaeota archaeon]
MQETILLTTLHDSSGWSINSITETVNLLDACYPKKIVILTKNTLPSVIEALKNSGWDVNTSRSEVGIGYISDSRKKLLEYGVKSGFTSYHLVDMDRLLHWAKTYPEELRKIANEIPKHKFLILGRTNRAYETHPINQKETECLPNKVVSLLCNQKLDVTAGSRGISSEAAEIIIQYSQGRYFDSDSEWPIIIRCKTKYEISFIEVEGLEWETLIKRSMMKLDNGSLVDVKEYNESNPESWTYRIMLANRISQCAYQTYQRLKKD